MDGWIGWILIITYVKFCLFVCLFDKKNTGYGKISFLFDKIKTLSERVLWLVPYFVEPSFMGSFRFPYIL